MKVEFIEEYIRVGNDYQWNDNRGELVRCKDCKYFQEETLLNDIRTAYHCGLIDSAGVYGYRNGVFSFDTTLSWRNEDDYCSRGERKEKEYG